MKLHHRLVFALVSKRAWPRELVEGPYYQALARRRSFKLVLLVIVILILLLHFAGMVGPVMPWLIRIARAQSTLIAGIVSAICVAWCIRLQRQAIPLSELRTTTLPARDALYFPAFWILQAFTLSLCLYTLFAFGHILLMIRAVISIGSPFFYFQFVLYGLPVGWFVAQRFGEFAILRALDLSREDDYFWRPAIRVVFSLPTLFLLGIHFSRPFLFVVLPSGVWNPLFSALLFLAISTSMSAVIPSNCRRRRRSGLARKPSFEYEAMVLVESAKLTPSRCGSFQT